MSVPTGAHALPQGAAMRCGTCAVGHAELGTSTTCWHLPAAWPQEAAALGSVTPCARTVGARAMSCTAAAPAPLNLTQPSQLSESSWPQVVQQGPDLACRPPPAHHLHSSQGSHTHHIDSAVPGPACRLPLQASPERSQCEQGPHKKQGPCCCLPAAYLPAAEAFITASGPSAYTLLAS
jgi:hypothetical protein